MSDAELFRRRIVEFVGEGIVEFGDLYEWVEEDPDMVRAADAAGLEMDEYLELLVDDEPRLYGTEGGFRRLDFLLDSLVFTHELTADEIAQSVIATHPDLAILDWDGTERFVTPGGDAVLNPVRDLALDGPDGWLRVFTAGDVVAVRRHQGVITLEPASRPLDTTLAGGLREAFDAFAASDGKPIQELAEVILMAADEVDTAFRTPVAPLAELIEAAGLETQGEWIGEAGADFSASGPVLSSERLRATVERWGMDQCCIDRLEWLLGVLENRVADDPRRIVESMGHEAVVLGLRDLLQGSGDLESEELGAWLDGVVRTTGRRAAPAITLRAFHHEVRGDAIAAEADLEEAHSYDPEFAPAAIELAVYLTMRSEFKRAVSLLNVAGSDGSAISDLFAGVHMDASGVGRNDACPCGSGRKYKVCHLGKPISTPAALVDTLLLKVRMFVTDLWRGAAGLPVLAFVAAEGDPQLVSAMYNDDFLQSVALFEGGGLDDFLDRMGTLLGPDELSLAESWSGRSLGLYETVTKGDDDAVTIRDVASGEQVTVEDRELWALGSEGSKILTWLVPSGSGLRIAPPVLTIGDHQVDTVVGLIESESGATDWASWYRLEAGFLE